MFNLFSGFNQNITNTNNIDVKIAIKAIFEFDTKIFYQTLQTNCEI
jgi:hypothetical protein